LQTHFSTTWRVRTTCILAGPLPRIDFWSATGFTLPGGKGGPIFSRWVVLSLIESKGFHYQPARPPSRLLSSWKPGRHVCFAVLLQRLSGTTESLTMSDMLIAAWRGGALLCYDMAGTLASCTPISHSTRPRRFPGCYRLLNRPAGRGLVPAQPIGSWRLANFDTT
jgi:hypothetical protein